MNGTRAKGDGADKEFLPAVYQGWVVRRAELQEIDMPVQLIHLTFGIAFVLLWVLIAHVSLQRAPKHRSVVPHPKMRPSGRKVRRTKMSEEESLV